MSGGHTSKEWFQLPALFAGFACQITCFPVGPAKGPLFGYLSHVGRIM